MCHSTNDKISTFLGCMENVKATFIWLILFGKIDVIYN